MMTIKEEKIAEIASLVKAGYLHLQCQSTLRGQICWQDCEPAKKRVCRQCGMTLSEDENATCEHCRSEEYGDQETILICPACGWWCRLDDGAAVLHELLENNFEYEENQ